MKAILKVLGILTITVACAVVGIFGDNIHSNYLRESVGNEVVMITRMEGRGGGTGFHVKARSGKTYILTNSHICRAADDRGYVLVKGQNENHSMPRKVIKHYTEHDLCVVEPLPGHEGIEVAGSSHIGEEAYIFGHPGLRPLTRSQGEIIGREQIKVGDRVNERGECDNGGEMRFTFFGPVCVFTYDAEVVSNPIYGGNSGSPVVDKFGHVIGVVFAGNADLEHGGDIVPLDYVQDFLRKY